MSPVVPLFESSLCACAYEYEYEYEYEDEDEDELTVGVEGDVAEFEKVSTSGTWKAAEGAAARGCEESRQLNLRRSELGHLPYAPEVTTQSASRLTPSGDRQLLECATSVFVSMQQSPPSKPHAMSLFT